MRALLLLCFSTPALTTMSALPCEPQSMEWIVCLDLHTPKDRLWCEEKHGWEFTWSKNGWVVK